MITGFTARIRAAGPLAWLRRRRAAAESDCRLDLDLFDGLFNAAPHAVVLQDRDGRVTRINPGFTALFGWSQDDIVGRNLDATVAAPEYFADAVAISNRAAQGEPVVAEAVRRTRDGRSVDVMISAAPVVCSGGHIGTFAVYEDIGARKRAEAALRRSEQSYRALVEQATVGVARTSLDGRFLLVNSALVNMLGYASEAELLAVPVRDLYADPAVRDRLLRAVGQGAGPGLVGIEVDWKRRDGTPVRLRANGRVVSDSGAAGYLEFIVEDVSNASRIEARLRQSQKMEALGRLTGGLAHDFNNVLAVILAHADQLLRGGDAPSGDGDLEAIRSAALHARAMVAKLLAFARQGSLERVPVDLGDVVRDAMQTFGRLIPASIEVRVESAGTLPAVFADPTAIDQIVLNLVTNARDAMPQGGVLRVRTSVDEATSPATVWLEVGDSGTGMDERTRLRIFEPFFTTKGADLGTGLGLATVYGLVTQHEGIVEVDSAPGRGTTFRIGFPASRETPVPTRSDTTPAAPAERAVPAGATILLVDDEPQLLSITQRMLTRWGYSVRLARDGQEALAVITAGEENLSLVITDMQMPRLGGLGLYHESRKAGCRAPFVFVSGDTGPTPDQGELPRDAVWLPKPWSAADFRNALTEALNPAGDPGAAADRR